MTTGRPQRLVWGIILVMVLSAIVASMTLWRLQAIKPRPAGWSVFLPREDILSLADDGERIWAGGRDGLFAIDRRSGAVTPERRDNRTFTYVRALLADPDGTLWIGHDAGLTRRDSAAPPRFTDQLGLPGRAVYALTRDATGRLWAGTDRGAAVLEGETWRPFTDGLMDPLVFSLLGDTYGGVWFGSYVAPRGGLFVLSAHNRQRFSVQEGGLPHNNVTALCALSDTVVWAATGLIDRGGVAEFIRQPDRGEWISSRSITKGDGLAGEKARSIFRARDGGVWVGSEYDGVAYRRGDRWRTLSTLDGLSHNEVRAMLEDGDGALWLATGAGVTQLDAEARRRLP